MELRNIAKAATFKSFPQIIYKNTITYFYDSVFQYFHETNINQLFLRVTQKYELRVSFKNNLRHIVFGPERF